MSRYFCCDERRRDLVRSSTTHNGIDYLEVPPDQTRLFVYFVRDLGTPHGLTKDNFRLEGGERIRDVRIVAQPHGVGPNCLSLRLNRFGDFSTYRLRLVAAKDDAAPPAWLDPELSSVEFSFKVSCPSDFDCLGKTVCPAPLPVSPDVNYLAKDYASFRQVLLDRLSLLMPDWRERSPADLQVALVELLAYVGDRLSYQQDAIATEAYLGTARRRVSARRHARLVDYHMHDGCNARVWVAITAQDGVQGELLPGPGENRPGTLLLTGPAESEPLVPPAAVEQELTGGATPFETMHDLPLYDTHNRLEFYTWGDSRCCLPAGSTAATLNGHRPHLKPGDVLILQEVKGPLTGEPEDADPTLRHAVRLTSVRSGDESTPLVDPVTGRQITEVEWSAADALPFPLCISSEREAEDGGIVQVDNVSVALGNVVLADHGITIADKPLPAQVPRPDQELLWSVPTAEPCESATREPVQPGYRPSLEKSPVTQAARADFDLKVSCSDLMRWSAADVRPCVRLTEVGSGDEWLPRRDLLGSSSDDCHFVVEVEADGPAALRFGDDDCGKQPDAGTEFTATYRVGSGTAGNVGALSVRRIVGEPYMAGLIAGLTNPLPAQGGLEPESIEDVRKSAPEAFRTQERAVTADDYAAMAERHPEVQKAAGTLRWTGSWYTVFATIDRKGGREVDAEFEADIRQHLEKYRMAGHDLEVDGPRYVPLEIELRVCVKPDFFRSDVKAALLDLFSNRPLPAGRCGLFHPDNFTFGQPVFLSSIYAAAQAVPGVAWVKVTRFQRQGIPSGEAVKSGRLVLNRLEIARLDNDPNFPERGVLRLGLEGGK